MKTIVCLSKPCGASFVLHPDDDPGLCVTARPAADRPLRFNCRLRIPLRLSYRRGPNANPARGYRDGP
jgi:hypothetical protein